MNKKPKLVSIIVNGRRYSAFIWTNKETVSLDLLHEIFPILNTLPRGATWSHG